MSGIAWRAGEEPLDVHQRDATAAEQRVEARDIGEAPAEIYGLRGTVEHLDGERYAVRFNVGGCSWAYEARFDEPGRRLKAGRVLVGQGDLGGGVLHGLHYDKESRRFLRD